MMEGPGTRFGWLDAEVGQRYPERREKGGGGIEGQKRRDYSNSRRLRLTWLGLSLLNLVFLHAAIATTIQYLVSLVFGSDPFCHLCGAVLYPPPSVLWGFSIIFASATKPRNSTTEPASEPAR
ncbi:hypothetical protein LX32DRAFT_454068 [Colletotrichum zoysiae]|uniref:Uncharacterized protein n=1 Tax=Colletotrichum zoysiae TaxID=1216348 RepID=A0AAD9HFH1_9PEZI|nr:hypothetical protein LX32DRAFT_454068 [Colletotrichum zoysiae]